jgi:hypothetical protein
MWLLKSPLDQNLIMIYHKFNGDFKNHINFRRIKRRRNDDIDHWLQSDQFYESTPIVTGAPNQPCKRVLLGPFYSSEFFCHIYGQLEM